MTETSKVKDLTFENLDVDGIVTLTDNILFPKIIKLVPLGNMSRIHFFKKTASIV